MDGADLSPASKRPRNLPQPVDVHMQEEHDGEVPESGPAPKVQELMKSFYRHLFPCAEFYSWLAYGNDSRHPQADSKFFQRREFCFTLDGDIFVRYQSFKDGSELHQALVQKVPAKIDIGPVYNVDPQRRKAYTGLGSENVFQPRQRELVFDIDLTDYDDVRTCGKEGHICNLCWPLMAAAVQVLDKALREDFGFQHILWVFSGRRGVHAWVCDRRARELTDEQRGCIASCLSVFKGQENGLVKLSLSHHPALDRAHSCLQTYWKQEILPKQRLLLEEVHWRQLLAYLPDEELRSSLASRWAVDNARGVADEEDCCRQRWAELVAEVAKVVNMKAVDKGLKAALQRGLREIVFAYAYPRLDVEVSKKRNHLLKAPFCVHPKTGKVCVPFDPADALEFDPETVPTVAQLLDELELAPVEEQMESESRGEGWQNTSLASSMTFFIKSFLEPLNAAASEELAHLARENALQPTLAW